MVVELIVCIGVVVLVVCGLIMLNQVRKQEIKTNKSKRSMYDAWYDLGVLLADIEKEKLNKEDK